MTTSPAPYMNAVNEIARQLGRAMVMIGGKHLCGSEDNGRPTLSFAIMRNDRKVTHIRVSLEKNDTYTVQFIRVVKYTHTVLSTHEMVYADMLYNLISEQTGLATRL